MKKRPPEALVESGDLDLRIGIAIRRIRELKSITQAELARRARVSQASVSMTENGLRNQRLNLKVLQRIAHGLGCNRLSDLIRFAEDVPQSSEVIALAVKYFGRKK